MREGHKLILGGIWVLSITLTSIWLLSLCQEETYYQIVILVWCFAFLGGVQFSSWCDWAKERKLKK